MTSKQIAAQKQIDALIETDEDFAMAHFEKLSKRRQALREYNERQFAARGEAWDGDILFAPC